MLTEERTRARGREKEGKFFDQIDYFFLLWKLTLKGITKKERERMREGGGVNINNY